jgi:hypothetical protein
MYVRVLAAIALAGSLPGMWPAGRNLFAVVARLDGPIAFPLIVLLMTLTLPMFLAALALSDRPLHFPARLRRWCFAAIYCFAAFIVIATAQHFKNILGYLPLVQKIFGPYLVSPNPLPVLPFLLDECSSAAQLLLLIAFYHNTDDAPQERTSRFLSLTAKTAAVVWGLWAAFNVLRLIAVPYTYVQLRDYAWHLGKTPPTVIQLVGEIMPALLSGVAFFALPFMVWRAMTATKLAEQEAQRL